jgi:hypothetical protein
LSDFRGRCAGACTTVVARLKNQKSLLVLTGNKTHLFPACVSVQIFEMSTTNQKMFSGQKFGFLAEFAYFEGL